MIMLNYNYNYNTNISSSSFTVISKSILFSNITRYVHTHKILEFLSKAALPRSNLSLNQPSMAKTPEAVINSSSNNNDVKTKSVVAVDKDYREIAIGPAANSNNSISPSSSNTESYSIAELLKLAEDKNILTYSTVVTKFGKDTVEFKGGGLAKFSEMGIDVYNKIKQEEFLKDPSSMIKVIVILEEPYESGCVRVAESTFLTTSTQEHLVVTAKAKIIINGVEQESRVIIGKLTSETDRTKKDHYLLTNDQPISGNTDKGQYFSILKKVLVITEEDFIKDNKATLYIRYPNIVSKIQQIVQNEDKLNNVAEKYNPYGNSTRDLERVMKVAEERIKREAEAAKITAEKLIKNPLNSEQESERLKKQIRADKRLEQEKKQREESIRLRKLKKENETV